jgi:hypothetical protein
MYLLLLLLVLQQQLLLLLLLLLLLPLLLLLLYYYYYYYYYYLLLTTTYYYYYYYYTTTTITTTNYYRRRGGVLEYTCVLWHSVVFSWMNRCSYTTTARSVFGDDDGRGRGGQGGSRGGHDEGHFGCGVGASRDDERWRRSRLSRGGVVELLCSDQRVLSSLGPLSDTPSPGTDGGAVCAAACEAWICSCSCWWR